MCIYVHEFIYVYIYNMHIAFSTFSKEEREIIPFFTGEDLLNALSCTIFSTKIAFKMSVNIHKLPEAAQVGIKN